MADGDAPPPGGASPTDRYIIARRTRNIAVWSIAFFIAAVPVAILGGGPTGDAAGGTGTGSTVAMVFWLLGVVAGVWSFGLAFRHWESLPLATRWLASLPLLVVLCLLATAVAVTVMT